MLVLKNNVDLVLPFAIAENQTNIALYVNAGKDLPALFTGDHARGAIRDNAGNVEYVKIVAVEGDNIILQRGQEGSVARAFSAGARLQLRMTARAWQDMALEFFTRVYNDDYTLIRPVATEVNSLVFQDDWLDVFQTGRAGRVLFTGGVWNGHISAVSFDQAQGRTLVFLEGAIPFQVPAQDVLAIEVGITLEALPKSVNSVPIAHLTDPYAHAALIEQLRKSILQNLLYVSNTPPADISRLWLNSNNFTLNFFFENRWVDIKAKFFDA